MSNYTTEVRFICEYEAGLDKSKGYNDVNSIIASARPKIFNFSYPIFDNNYKSVIETKILKHFYTREIGFETVGLWKLKLDTKMNEIMPYYNKLYESELIEFDPMKDFDYTREIDRTTENDGTVRNAGQTSNHSETETENTHYDKFSDTPQGGLSGLDNDTYLTNARKITDDGGNEVNGSTSSDFTQTNDLTTTEDYLEKLSGKHGSASYSQLLQDYRRTLLNIDMQVINDLDELFMQLW